ncbi:MAG TPA: DnaJ domain-containing protein [Candidatus Saccharimonadales bacterium]|nr:DnaJ domain-containing protein [Candidatus Saccharimonadales bacterium]
MADPYRTPDAYKALQVDFEADVDVIQAAYRRLAQKYHPDRVDDPHSTAAAEAKARMVAINAAWAILRDPVRRAAYDRVRAAFLAATPRLGTRATATGADQGTHRGSARTSDGGERRPGASAMNDGGPGGGPGSGQAAGRTSAWARRMQEGDAPANPDSVPREGVSDRRSSTPEGRLGADGLGHELRSRTGDPGLARVEGVGGPVDRAADRPYGGGGRGSREPGGVSGGSRSGDPSEPHAGPPPGRPSGSLLTFGRYSGWSLGEIGRIDPGYLEWLDRMPIGRPYRAELDELLRRLGRRQSEAIEASERRGLFRRR